ncbi:membrane-anchored junction protein isoform X2 [Erinaceus europaeus]|uniref:Membrane-anchored junction protein isoform X2 n=1 Tax=Erinaceus europaeus TaxID=9365 RepID=A0ABM3W6E2_ERIEU|nr:membrane-anchored junction protein isoform X2 [Erinaceus europaeus]
MHLCGEELPTEPGPSEHQKQLRKKQKNRAAAQRSRQKHTDKADTLHQELEGLEKQNHELQKVVEQYREELAWWSRVLQLHNRQCPGLRASSYDALASTPPPGLQCLQPPPGPFQGPPAPRLSAQQLPPDAQGCPGLLLSPGPPPSPDPAAVTAPSAQLYPRPLQPSSPASCSLLSPPPTLTGPLPSSSPQPLGQKLGSSSHSPSATPGYYLEAMNLKPFTYPFPETRFLHAGTSVYKFKIRYGNNIRGEEIENKEVIFQELEDSIRVVLGNPDNLQPFATEHFVVFPYKSKWERVSHLKFKHGEIILVPYPFVFTLYVELKWCHEHLSPGSSANHSPLELVHTHRKDVRDLRRKRKHEDVPRSPSGPGLDRVRMGTCSQGPSSKKPLMETKRNRERKTQLEWQDPPAFRSTDVQEQDPQWGLGPAEHITPPLQQDSPPRTKGPSQPGPSGFFGFISSLFPFRYFFRRSSQ